MRDAAERFEGRMLDGSKLFPCVFGVDAVRRSTLRYCFVPAGPERVRHLAVALSHFAAIAPALGNRTSLVAFFEPDGEVRGLTDWSAHFWDLLQQLHERDGWPWPTDIAVDPEAPEWEFSFAGTPFFVVANTPAHVARRSRYFDYFAITFQPRFVFDGLEASSRSGQNARRVIRRRLTAYDDTAPSVELGSFGAAHNREWTQYFLDDSEQATPTSARCPFNPRVSQQAEEQDADMTPTFATQPVPEIDAQVRTLLPAQGSLELQRDMPGKVHDWHRHSLDEELFVLEGHVLLFWDEEGTLQERRCTPGTWITLPAGTVHGSIAGSGGAVYVIRPEDGRTAETVFLPREEHPHPTPTPAAVGGRVEASA